MLNHLDSFAGNCGLSLPTLFERIGSMAAHGQHRPRDFPPRAFSAHRACSDCGNPSLPDTPATRNAGPEAPARPPVKTTATSIGSRTGRRPGNRDTDGEPRASQATAEAAHAATRASVEYRLRRRHRPPRVPDLPEHLHGCAGSTTGKRRGIDKPSRGPIDGLTDRRVRPTAAVFPGENP